MASNRLILTRWLERVPVHFIVVGSAWASRVLTALLQLASVRVLTESLGLELYAVFALLTSLMGWYLLLDFGLGVSLQNTISEFRANKKNYDGLLAVLAVAAISLMVIATLILHAISPWLSNILLTQFTYIPSEEKRALFEISGIAYVVMAIATISYKIWYAEHRGYLANMLPALGAVLGYLGIIYVNLHGGDNKLLWSVAAYIIPTAVLPFVALLKQAYPRLKRITNEDIKLLPRVISRAARFWLFGLMAAFVLQVDYIVMSQLLPATEIATYNLVTKIFGLVFFIFSSVLMALWPMFSEAIASNNVHLMRQKIRLYLGMGIGYMVIATLVLSFLMPEVISILSPRESVNVPLLFILLLGFYQTIRVWTDMFAMALQSMSELRPFMLLVPVQAAISVVMQILLVPRLGIYGVVAGLICSFLLTVSWGLPFALKNKLQGLQEQPT